MNKKRIVITGGPGTGKTSVIKKLETNGFFCFHEVIRDMTKKAKSTPENIIKSNPIVSVSDPYTFNLEILNGRLKQFHEATTKEDDILFYDRGVPDVVAYMDYFNQSYNKEFVTACETNRYNYVFLLPPWEAIFVSDNERYENFDQATGIHKCLHDTYNKYGYNCIEVPFGSIEKRCDFILKNIE